MMGEPDPDLEPEWEEWMDAPLLERLAPYRYYFMAGCFFLLLPPLLVFLILMGMSCGIPAGSDSGLCSYLP